MFCGLEPWFEIIGFFVVVFVFLFCFCCVNFVWISVFL